MGHACMSVSYVSDKLGIDYAHGLWDVKLARKREATVCFNMVTRFETCPSGGGNLRIRYGENAEKPVPY